MQIFFNKGPYHLFFKALLRVNEVIRNAEVFGDVARVVHVVDGATAALYGFGHDLAILKAATREPALVPQLQRKADHGMPFLVQHGRHSGGIDTPGHRHGNDFAFRHRSL